MKISCGCVLLLHSLSLPLSFSFFWVLSLSLLLLPPSPSPCCYTHVFTRLFVLTDLFSPFSPPTPFFRSSLCCPLVNHNPLANTGLMFLSMERVKSDFRNENGHVKLISKWRMQTFFWSFQMTRCCCLFSCCLQFSRALLNHICVQREKDKLVSDRDIVTLLT